MKRIKGRLFVLSLAIHGVTAVNAYGGEAEDLAAMQRQLNAGVMEQEFDAGDVEKINAYVAEAMKKDLKPRREAPDYWQPGYTCASIRYRGWRDYRDCRYYYHYYGRYW